MKIKSDSDGDQTIIVESNTEIDDLKAIIEIFIYNSVCEINDTHIYIEYGEYYLKIGAICEIDQSYFYVSSSFNGDEFIGVCLDKKDVPLKRIAKLIYKQFLLTIKYDKHEFHKVRKKENVEVL